MSMSPVPKNSTTVRSQNAVRLTRAALQAAYMFSDELGASFAERLFTSPHRHPRPARERAVLASARRFTIEVALRSPRWNGTTTKVAAWRWGLGPTVLLVHGWEGRGSQLAPLVEPLVSAGLSVVTFDAPGHGDSPGNRLYLTDFADAIVDVAEAIGPLYAIVAHSFGAPATLLAYSRGGVDAPRNVMIAPNAIVHDAVDKFARLLALDDADKTTFLHHLSQNSGVSVESLSLATLIGGRDSGMTVIHDRDDREIAFELGAQLAATWPNARLVATEGLGHRRILRDPAVIHEVVETIREGLLPPASDLVREVDRMVEALEARSVGNSR